MALKSPLMPSPTGGVASAFSPYTDSPHSPAAFKAGFAAATDTSNSSNTTNSRSDSSSLAPPPSPYPTHVDPSPVDSNGTENTEIEDSAQEGSGRDEEEEEEEEEVMSPDNEINSASPSSDALPKIRTNLAAQIRSDSDDAPQSVIHVPDGFKSFNTKQSGPFREKSPTEESENTVVSLHKSESDEKRASNLAVPIDTSIPSATPPERETPRAHTRQEVEDEQYQRRSRASPSLADIPEAQDLEKAASEDLETELTSDYESGDESHDDRVSMAIERLNKVDSEIFQLKTALNECWTLCNTLAGLSYSHRERMFSFSGNGEVHEQAWQSCWRLCQKLYESRDESSGSQVGPTLELCRDFCQALFEARLRGDEAADSVLRVSFELNNHLYNTHDRKLPEAFRERTLDFYVTLCHRLMKQRTSLPEETDSLLRACWTLAETLFSIRQNNRDDKPADEELLSSAVQACWDLSNLFREGWSQVRPDKGTPKPNQSTFGVAGQHLHHHHHHHHHVSSNRSEISSSVDDSYHSVPSIQSLHAPSYSQAHPGQGISMRSLPPETPTTIFDDVAESPHHEPSLPNILVLGPDQTGSHAHTRWSSSASTLSTYSNTASSHHTGSTATASVEDAQLNRIRVLLVKAAADAGYTSASALSDNAESGTLAGNPAIPQTSLPSFVKSLPSNTFGTLPWQTKLLDQYKKLVLSDASLRPMTSINSSNSGNNNINVNNTMGGSPSGNSPSDNNSNTFGGANYNNKTHNQSGNVNNNQAIAPSFFQQLPPATRRASAVEVARAVQWMAAMREGFVWLRDLYRLVFGFFPEDATGRGGDIIQA